MKIATGLAVAAAIVLLALSYLSGPATSREGDPLSQNAFDDYGLPLGVPTTEPMLDENGIVKAQPLAAALFEVRPALSSSLLTLSLFFLESLYPYFLFIKTDASHLLESLVRSVDLPYVPSLIFRLWPSLCSSIARLFTNCRNLH